MIPRILVFLLFLAGVASAQEDGAFERLPLRVASVTPSGAAVVDRGTADLVQSGDLVLLEPRDGGSFWGTVTEVGERSAVVEMHVKSYAPSPGVRGEVLIPRERFTKPKGDSEEPAEADAERPPWKNKDDVWSPGDPLLARVKPMRPEERSLLVTGRLYLGGDVNWRTDGNGSDSLFRTGADVSAENPFGLGGTLRFYGDLNQRTTRDPDEGDDDDFDFRLNRLSYAFGGTRFADMSWEIGRFLQRGVPEFGVLDGLEWGHRLRGGDRVGASVGFLPEPDADFESFEDFSFSAYYRWVSDEREQITALAGFQKTFHNGESDRDLLFLRARYVPIEGWDLHGAAWVDFYGGANDDVKDASVELTQAILSATRVWKSGNGLDVTYRRILFPELLRNEFLNVTEEELADNRHDRLSASGWRFLERDRRLHGEAGVWIDEDDAGGDAEVGLEFRDVIVDYGRADVTAFGARGNFEIVGGARASFGRATPAGGFDVFYEIAQHHEDGFSSDRDDILQHRLRASFHFYDVFGCTLSLYAQANLFDDETGVSSGFFLQRAF